MSETTRMQIIFAIGHKVYEKIGMIDHITRWISAQWETPQHPLVSNGT